ncbi:Malonyl-CoA-acyl carrier protein transacylase [Durusdinium trenchii]|uniref:Mitochondrial (MCT) (Mitochondrial malonyltransferase) ([Acyl-carrier-protein] malonyltransferase) n=1 Tax=Durusdinium trenchii TaxID=1381693 RepID=A0ABP0IE93_9DINO
MPGVKPVTVESRAGIQSRGLGYEPSWSSIPFESYEGMTQLQFQEANAPFLKHGGQVPLHIPPGWRRVESKMPGKHFYVQRETGTIQRMPADIFHPKEKSWMTADGKRIAEDGLNDNMPDLLALELAYGGGGKAKKAVVKPKVIPVALPEEPEKQEKPKAALLEPEPVASAPARALPVGLLFPGQGSQYVKMMAGVKDIPAVKDMLEKANNMLDFNLLDLCLKGPEPELERTKACQPAMYVAGLAAVEKLRAEKPEKVERCQAVAGLSLGEYTALTVAGVFDFETGLKVVKLRGEAMQEAAEASQQAMLSVAGLDKDTLTRLCAEACEGPNDVCQVANFLFPNGFSCAGTLAAIQRLEPKVKATEGCLQAKMLKTSGGFHTKLMQPARDKLLDALQDALPKMKPPRCDVYMNVTGKKIAAGTPPAEIWPLLADQLVNCVQWEPSILAMIQDGVSEYYECGPMKQLKAMMKRIDSSAFASTTTIDV